MKTRVICAGLIALGFASCAAGQDRNSYYWNRGERVAVVVAPSSVALRFLVDPDPALIARIGDANGLQPNPNEVYSPLRRNRAVVYSVPGAAEVTNRYLADLQQRLTASGAPVAEIGRVITTTTGRVAVVTQQLSVGFIDGVTGLRDLRGLDVERLVSIVDRMSERPLVVQYSVNADSELTPLEIANAIYEYRDPSGRQLVTYSQAALQFPAGFRTIPNQPRQPNDAKYPLQWHLDGSAGDVDAPEAWDYTRGSTSTPSPGGCVVAQRIRIAVLDSGVQMNHADLVDNLSLEGRDYTRDYMPGDPAQNNPNPSPADEENRHGTQAAGVIAACGHNNIGVSGVCPLCEILPLRINPSDATRAAKALLYARDHGADVVSLSWGSELLDPLENAFNELTGTNPVGPGIPIFVATAEEPAVTDCGTDISAASNVIAVGSSTKAGLAGTLSSSGACIDLVAPTVSYLSIMDMVITTDFIPPGSAYTFANSGFGGTSSATALAAGIAGLVLSLNPALTEQDVRNILQHTAKKITVTGGGMYDLNGFNPMAGYGEVNAHRAVVPVVKITTTANSMIQPNQPFNVTVSASAPHLLSSIGWSMRQKSCPASVEGWRAVSDKAFHAETWTLALTTPGTYVFRPNAKDKKFPANDGYPHIASDATLALPEVEIKVQGTAPGCLNPPPTPIENPAVRPSPPTNLGSN